MTALATPASRAVDALSIARLATACLKLEVATYPKPGLVSHVDQGSHRDMDVALLERSADALTPYFEELAAAGAAGAQMGRLRGIGIAAEAAMLAVTKGVNTHRGAIFGMGLLCAAAGFRAAYHPPGTLGTIVSIRWGPAILAGPTSIHSHGAQVSRQHGVGGARREAAAGFPSLYAVALPAFVQGRQIRPHDDEAVRVHACMALIAEVDDTNLLHRGGRSGLEFAQSEARAFLDAGGIADDDWRVRAAEVHASFVARNLSPGGCADLLAMALLVEGLAG